MSEQVQQTETAGAAPTSASPTSTKTSSHPAASMVQTMLSRGEREPRVIASIMDAHPDARIDILSLLHATAGNAFVQEVAATKHDEEPKAADVPLGPVRVTASALRIRSAPSTASKKTIIGRLPRGSVVTAQAKDGDWIRIEHNGETGFIHGDYVVSMTAPPKKAEPKQGGEEDDGGNATHEVAAPAVPVVAPNTPVAAPIAPVVASPANTPVDAPIAPIEAAPAQDAGPPAPAQVVPDVQPAPVQTTPVQAAPPPTTTTAPDTKNEAKPDAAPDLPAALGGTYKGVYSNVYSTGSQVSQVWVSEGGVSATPNIYIHFHGHRTDYGIDDDLEWHEGGMKENKKTGKMEKVAPKSHRKNVDKGGSGYRAAQQAMNAAAGQNTIAILPQGVLGEGAGGAHEGGYMKDLESMGLSAYLDKILKPLAKHLGVANLSPGNIALGGHSAGGYEGIHSAMRRLDDGEKDEALMDKITDVTLYDASYGSGNHLDETRTWAFHEGPVGTPTKNVRLVNGWAQQTERKDLRKAHDLWYARFGEPKLEAYAAKQKPPMTIRPVGDVGTKLDNETKVMQHTQIVRQDGSIQADVLVVMFSAKGGRDHEPLRDRMIDDAIMSIGDGAAGNAQFGKHDKGKLVDKISALEHEDDDHDDDALTGTTAKADADKPETQTLPQPKHVEGDEREAPEKVEEPPAVKDPPKKAKKAAKKDEEREKLFDELYNDETGRVRASKLNRTVKRGKKTYEITEDEYKFKQLCYKLATESMKGRLFGGVDDDELGPIPGSGQKIRKEVLPDLNNLISAAKSAGHKIRVTSGYRPPEEDMAIWDSAFNRMYIKETKKQREKRWPDDPLGEEAAKYLVHQIRNRKAPPGKSNHSNGIAVDFTATVNGKDISNAFNDQTGWRTGSGKEVYKWLLANCKSHNFQNLKSEAWHYDWKP